MEILAKYFPNLSEKQLWQYNKIGELYRYWNSRINVISRKDIDFLYLRHILYSLSIAKVFQFNANSLILDVGTGGGFPGIPLAIIFPDTNFVLIDSIGKKIKVVKDICAKSEIKNITCYQSRAESIKTKYDFIISRAVTAFPDFVNLVKKNIALENKHSFPNSIIYLKGGNFEKEVKRYGNKIKIFSISDFFEEEYFETKKIIALRF